MAAIGGIFLQMRSASSRYVVLKYRECLLILWSMPSDEVITYIVRGMRGRLDSQLGFGVRLDGCMTTRLHVSHHWRQSCLSTPLGNTPISCYRCHIPLMGFPASWRYLCHSQCLDYYPLPQTWHCPSSRLDLKRLYPIVWSSIDCKQSTETKRTCVL